MFEALLTSFPAVIRYLQLRRRGEAMTLWNMKSALFLWGVLAFCLFLVIFYYHPKTYASIVPFRTISVVAQTAGPVTALPVTNLQRVRAGDLLFRIEDSAQRAALAEARAQLVAIDADEAKAVDAQRVAQASVEQAQVQLVKLRDDLKDSSELLKRGLASEDAVFETRTTITATEAELDAALAQLDNATVDLEQSIPARRDVAQAAVDSAEVALSFTEVRSFADGTVSQLALSVGSPASTLILSPAMVIIPDRPADVRVPIIAGFSQVARSTLYLGMPVEVACETNANLLYRNAVLPGRIVSMQPAVSKGQVVPSGELLDMKYAVERGSVHARVELLHPEHELQILDGSGCIVQAYTNNLDGVFGHVISATGLIKAAGLRMKVFGAIASGVGLVGGAH